MSTTSRYEKKMLENVQRAVSAERAFCTKASEVLRVLLRAGGYPECIARGEWLSESPHELKECLIRVEKAESWVVERVVRAIREQAIQWAAQRALGARRFGDMAEQALTLLSTEHGPRGRTHIFEDRLETYCRDYHDVTRSLETWIVSWSSSGIMAYCSPSSAAEIPITVIATMGDASTLARTTWKRDGKGELKGKLVIGEKRYDLRRKEGRVDDGFVVTVKRDAKEWPMVVEAMGAKVSLEDFHVLEREVEEAIATQIMIVQETK